VLKQKKLHRSPEVAINRLKVEPSIPLDKTCARPPPHHILFPDSSVFALPSFAVNLLLTRFPFIISQLVITSLSTDFTDYTDSKRSVDILADTSSPAAVS
jgi:hypothetical protein